MVYTFKLQKYTFYFLGKGVERGEGMGGNYWFLATGLFYITLEGP